MSRLIGEAYFKLDGHRDYLGSWNASAEWSNGPRPDRHEWLKRNVVGDVDLQYVNRAEFFRVHVSESDPEHVVYTAILYRYAKNAVGSRYILKDADGAFVLDEFGHTQAAMLEPTEVIVRFEPPEELR